MVTTPHHDLIKDLIDSELSIGDQIRFKVVSNSMAPIIKVGDSVVVNVSEFDSIKRGDIIVIQREDDFLTHRAIKLIKSNDPGWRTKGDNSVLFDPPAKAEHIIGYVLLVDKRSQPIKFQSSSWARINRLLAKLSELEAKAFIFHPKFRYPFRLGIKVTQRYLMWRSH